MNRGASVTDPTEATLLVQRALTVAISAYNAIYFSRYRLRTGRRRLGAVVLAFISLAIAGGSVAFGLLTTALSRLVALKYKLSDRPTEELSKNIASVLRGIGGALEPERFDGV